MKQLFAVLAAAVVAAAVLLHPVPPPFAAGPSGRSPGSAPDPSAAQAGSSSASVSAGWTSSGLPGAGVVGRRTPPPQAMVYVAGDVVRPGVYPVRSDARVRDALALAGGSRPDADLVAVNLAAHVRDGDEVVVPVRGAPETLPAARGARAHGHGRRTAGPRRAAGGRHKRSRRDEPPPAYEVDINTADAATLATIPGIGDGLAERIIAFRTQNGPFASIDELLDVAGITEHRLDAIIPYVVAR